jgi:signal transduction histidine kinase/AraC-like DNA-binding protein/DNA-binding response OmpR family regulator
VLDRRLLVQAFADLVQSQYGYDQVHVWAWSESEQRLSLMYPAPSGQLLASLPVAEAGLLREALLATEGILIPDTRYSRRHLPDPRWPETRGRVVLPIRFAEQILGLLDLHQWRPRQHIRDDMLGLQALADQLGIALSNAELYTQALHARAAAEKADQLKTRLLANVSHELREPLNVILGYTKAALTDPNPYQATLPEGLSQDLQRVFSSGEHLIRLINDLLDLSRAEIGELDLFPETIAPRTFLEQVFHSFADNCDAKPNVDWQLCVPERLPMIQADPVRLRQILLNLLSNARKFTTAGHIALGARVDPPHLHLWVEDTGSGIPAEQQDLIFEPFVTIERADRRPQGIGLGLSITRRLVALHGGTITLDSVPDKGSTFHVYFPLPNLSGQPARPNLAPSRRELLLVSASVQPPQEVIEMSKRGGWTIRQLSACTPLETMLKETQPALLVVDLTQAGRDDWTLVQRLHNHPLACRLPLIVYSGQDPQGSTTPLGITDVITKPVSGETLMETLQSIVPAGFVGPIWVVDDSARTREFYVRLAAKALPGHPVREFSGGAATLERMAVETPGLVILDLIMPDVDGFEVLERLRAEARTRCVPVVVMSGKVLTVDDLRRLDYAHVMLQTKGTLTEDEIIAYFQRVFSGATELPPPTSALVKRVLVYIYQNYGRPLSRQEIARAVGVSESYLSHIFRHEMGLSPWEWLTRLRVERAKELLAQANLSITEVACRVGFEDPAYFSRVFRKSVGQTCQAYRKQAQQAVVSD